ncbi:MAG: TerD family protein [Alphaproteobacteria bacterium]
MADILDTQFEGKKIELEDNRVKVGDEVNITAKDPTLRRLMVGIGWDINVFNVDSLDLDVSMFMLGKDEMTRNDDDFVFYNQPNALDNGIRHGGDSRTGAGDGDDETILIDLHSVPFDVMKLVFVLSIYRGKEKMQNMGMVRNAYFRLVNDDSTYEIVRYQMSEDLEDKGEKAMVIASLNREGPKWHFKPVAEFIEGGLKEIAERYGLLIVEQ